MGKERTIVGDGRRPMRSQLDVEVLGKVVKLLVDAAHPKRIILFGSYARGEQTPESDLDLLVIEDDVADRFRERVRLRRSLAPIRMPIDVLVYSESDVRTRGHWLGPTDPTDPTDPTGATAAPAAIIPS
jgi:predicted nucleotidyltransferase